MKKQTDTVMINQTTSLLVEVNSGVRFDMILLIKFGFGLRFKFLWFCFKLDFYLFD